jgi:glycosyltransferase involved in cell wall biosynthesis
MVGVMISIITINLNNREGLENTIKSVIAQTIDKEKIEYIVIDGDSTDGSKEVIEKYKDSIDYYISEKDGGIYEAMNKGITVAKGNYILFLNSADILYKPTTISDAIWKLRGDIVYGSVLDKGKVKVYSDDMTIDTFILGAQNGTWGLCHNAAFIKKSLFDNNLYDEDLKCFSDWKHLILAIEKRKATTKRIDDVVTVFDGNGFAQAHRHICNKETVDFLKYYFPDFFNNIPMERKQSLFPQIYPKPNPNPKQPKKPKTKTTKSKTKKKKKFVGYMDENFDF